MSLFLFYLRVKGITIALYSLNLTQRRSHSLPLNLTLTRSHSFPSTQPKRDRIPSIQSNHAREFSRSR
ncbi:MAG: hypothetical protein RID53_26230 [Coleofasciculus sp. B1-GNL1-01]|uniref:hypothetical protein n=1 Tax=Coleofasciculus sp. B1-GNL1-01 TaxID=3068484 RepID=UPI0032F75A9C